MAPYSSTTGNVASAYPELSFSIDNAGKQNTVYVSTDPAANQLTLVILTTADTTFIGGTLVAPGAAENANGSLLYLDLSTLGIPSDDFADITCLATGWQYQCFEGSVIGLAPTNTVNLLAGQAIRIAINNVVVPTQPAAGNVSTTLTYYRVTGYTAGNMPMYFFFDLVVQQPSNGGNLHGVIKCELNATPFIVIRSDTFSTVTNTIGFALSPDSGYTEPVIATSDTLFKLFFVYADAGDAGYGALTTAQSAAAGIQVTTTTTGWIITPNTGAESPYWLLQPPSGDIESAEFTVSGISTWFEPGSTQLYLQYDGVTGYTDGVFCSTLQKVPHAQVSSLTVTPNPAVLKDGKAAVNIYWDAADFFQLKLIVDTQSTDVTNQQSLPVTLTKSAAVVLVGVGQGEENTDTFGITASVTDTVISSFSVSPASLYLTDFPHEVTFSWECESTRGMILRNDSTNETYQVTGLTSIDKTVAAAGTWSLYPEDGSTGTVIAQTAVRSFDAGVVQLPYASPLTMAIPSPTAEFLFLTTGDEASLTASLNVVNALNLGAYDVTIDLGGLIPFNGAFSNDGHYFFLLAYAVTTPYQASLVVIRNNWDRVTGSYSFTVTQTIPFDQERYPISIAIADDDSFLLIPIDAVSLESGKWTGTDVLVFDRLINAEGDDVYFTQKLTLDFPVTIASPIGISPDSQYAYVPVGGDAYVYKMTSGRFSKQSSVALGGSGCSSMALGGKDGSALVSVTSKDFDKSSKENAYFIVGQDESGAWNQKKKIGLPGPATISTTHNGAYALVAERDKTISLISCYQASASTLLKSVEGAGSVPQYIFATRDNSAAYMGAGAMGAVWFVLADYKWSSDLPAASAQPTNVAVSPDGATVASWYNARLGDGDATGIVIYKATDGSQAPAAAGSGIVDCVFAPSGTLLYCCQEGLAQVTVIDTSAASPALAGSINVPAQNNGVARYPVAIAHALGGSYLYVLACDSTARYSFIAYEWNVASNMYSFIQSTELFTSTSTDAVMLVPSADGSTIFVSSAARQEIRYLKPDGKGKYDLSLQTINTSAPPISINMAPDSQTLYAILKSTSELAMLSVTVADMTTTKYLFPASYRSAVDFRQAVISETGTRLFITDAATSCVQVMSTETFRIVQTLAPPDETYTGVSGIAIDASGSALYVTWENADAMKKIGLVSES